MEEAYGCFPAVLACLLASLGVLAVGLSVSEAHASERWVGSAALGAVTLAGAWTGAVMAARAPRGKWAGAAALVAVAVFTVVVCCAAAQALW